MGQILNRIYRIAKSWVDDFDHTRAEKTINSDDEELKKIIDELNNDRRKNEENQRKDNKSESGEKSGPNPETYRKIDLNYAYEILGVPQNAGVEEIKAAYKKKVKDYHPDRVASLGKELQDLARKKTQEINGAYGVIRKYKNF